jgi:hypothetical protein
VSPTTSTLQASLRECRMVLERLVLIERLDPGLTPAVRDCALFSAFHRRGFDHVRPAIESLRATVGRPPVLREHANHLEVDCGGAHAWLVADALTDLAVDLFRRGRPATVEASNVVAPDELAVIPYLGEAHRLEVRLEGPRLSVVGGRVPTSLDRIRREGISVQREVWWSLFLRANDALAPDSFESRRHAGPIMVDAEGRVIGRADEDETDFNLLAEPALLAAGLKLPNGG